MAHSTLPFEGTCLQPLEALNAFSELQECKIVAHKLQSGANCSEGVEVKCPARLAPNGSPGSNVPVPNNRKGPMLTLIAWISLALSFACATLIAVDEMRRPQKMWIMNIVWPVTALYLSVFAVWAYFRLGRGMTKQAMESMPKQMIERTTMREGRSVSALAASMAASIASRSSASSTCCTCQP